MSKRDAADSERTALLEQWHDLFPDVLTAMKKGRIPLDLFEEFMRIADPEASRS